MDGWFVVDIVRLSRRPRDLFGEEDVTFAPWLAPTAQVDTPWQFQVVCEILEPQPQGFACGGGAGLEPCCVPYLDRTGVGNWSASIRYWTLR